MSYSSVVVIVILVFGVLFSTLYFSSELSKPRHEPDSIPTKPNISQLQAIEIAEEHLRSEIPNLEAVSLFFSLYNFSDNKYEFDDEYANYINSVIAQNRGWDLSTVKQNPELLQLPLIFVHANGTTYSVNSTSLTFQKLCETPSTDCPFGTLVADPAMRDRLIYRIESIWRPPVAVPPSDFIGEGYHIVDAETGELVWNSIDHYKNRRPAPPNIDYEGHKTIRERINERLNPPEVTRVSIVLGASDASQMQNFVPGETRGIYAISNKVVWTNKDAGAHTVRSDESYTNPYTGEFFSDMINPNESFEYTFLEVGEYPYHCDIHPWMQGNVEILPNFA